MTVHFIGAGPGASDLLTLRGRNLIQQSPVCLYAGSLIPEAILAHARPGTRLINTAEMVLDHIIEEIRIAHQKNEDVARLHSGDLSIWSAMAEQITRLEDLGIPYDITPGVPSFAAAAAAMRCELTLPGIAQTVILTRTSNRSTPMPTGEDLITLSQPGATIALHLSIANIGLVVNQLTPRYGSDCPVVVVHRVTWPDEQIVRGTLNSITEQVHRAGIKQNALIFVGRSLGQSCALESHLYSTARDRKEE
jgi:precorrin-4/cobalt-precorrin-4 C11-methyltransferase